MQHPVRVEVTPNPLDASDGPPFTAKVNGVEIPVVTYGVEPAEGDGQALVSLLIPADSVSIGDPSTGAGQPQVRPSAPEPKNARVGVWGDPAKPDPRANFPGRQPETLGQQVAENAEMRVSFKSSGDPILAGLRDFIRVNAALGGSTWSRKRPVVDRLKDLGLTGGDDDGLAGVPA